MPVVSLVFQAQHCVRLLRVKNSVTQPQLNGERQRCCSDQGEHLEHYTTNLIPVHVPKVSSCVLRCHARVSHIMSLDTQLRCSPWCPSRCAVYMYSGSSTRALQAQQQKTALAVTTCPARSQDRYCTITCLMIVCHAHVMYVSGQQAGLNWCSGHCARSQALSLLTCAASNVCASQQESSVSSNSDQS
jgi:hypothetical protein